MTDASTPDLAVPARPAQARLIRRLLWIGMRKPALLVGFAILVTIMMMAVFAEAIFPGDPMDMVGPPTLWPGQQSSHPLGTDSLGRDVAAGIVYGARASLLVGFLSASVGLVLGMIVGALAGYSRGLTASVAQRGIELFQTMPSFILVIVIVAITTPTVLNIAIAIGLATWPTIARLTRAQFLSLRETEFVLAARSLGFRPWHIVVREILPNALSPIIVTVSVMVANAILIEAGLSFLNMGDPNLISWGAMIGEGRSLLRTAWYLSAIPGAAIALTVLSLNLIGDALNDVLNPRARG